MDFLSRTQVVTAFGAVALALFVLDLVRRRRLSEEYSLLWVACTVTIAALGFSTPLLLWLTRLLGMTGAASVALPDGRVLVAGGKSDGVLSKGIWTFDPGSSAWTSAGRRRRRRLTRLAIVSGVMLSMVNVGISRLANSGSV